MPEGPSASANPIEFARQWSKLPPEHLRIALKSLDRQLDHEHEFRVRYLEVMEKADRHSYVLYMTGLVTAFVIVMCMLGGAIFVGLQGQTWLAALFAGPSVLALATLFVLRRTDSHLNRSVGRAPQSAPAPVPDPLPNGAMP